MKKLKDVSVLALICAMALAGCGNSADSAAETENGEESNAVISENENVPINFNVRVTDARTDGNELSIMYMVSLPENERPASDMEFESIRLMAGAEEADCEFDGAEVYSDNGENAVYTVDYVFDKDVPAGTYGLVLENFGYYEGEAFSAAVEGSWTRNCVVGSDKTSAEIDVAGETADDDIELIKCELKQTSVLIKYKYAEKAGLDKVVLNFTDGETLEVSNTTDKTVSSETSANEATEIINLNEMIDINDVESIDIMGKVFEL